MTKEMYLNLDLIEKMIEQNCYFESSSYEYKMSSVTGYAVIEHVYDILESSESEDKYYLADCISNIRKAINYRVADIFKNLGLNKIKFEGYSKDKKLQKLEVLNIAKPRLVDKLLKIRNNIEYNGDNPPDKNECEELAEFVWYFYKSTDRYCNILPDDFLIDWMDSEYYISLSFDFENHNSLRIRGKLPSHYFSNEKQVETAILLQAENVKREKESVSFSENISIEDIPNYIEILSLSLCEWGN